VAEKYIKNQKVKSSKLKNVPKDDSDDNDIEEVEDYLAPSKEKKVRKAIKTKKKIGKEPITK